MSPHACKESCERGKSVEQDNGKLPLIVVDERQLRRHVSAAVRRSVEAEPFSGGGSGCLCKARGRNADQAATRLGATGGNFRQPRDRRSPDSEMASYSL